MIGEGIPQIIQRLVPLDPTLIRRIRRDYRVNRLGRSNRRTQKEKKDESFHGIVSVHGTPMSPCGAAATVGDVRVESRAGEAGTVMSYA